MSFESLYEKIISDCSWEQIPKDKVSDLIKVIQNTGPINKMIESLEFYTEEMIKDDAGDIADERWRLSTIISMILEQTKLEIDDFLLQKLESTNSFTQSIIVKALGQRKFHNAKSIILNLRKNTNEPHLMISCDEAIKNLR